MTLPTVPRRIAVGLVVLALGCAGLLAQATDARAGFGSSPGIVDCSKGKHVPEVVIELLEAQRHA